MPAGRPSKSASPKWPCIADWFSGHIQDGDEPATIYVAQLKNHPEFVKLGFCKLTSRNLRRGDPELGQILYETCRDDEIMDWLGDLTKADAWLLEQYLLTTANAYIEIIPELANKKWPGYTETLRIKDTALGGFLDWIQQEASDCLLKGDDGYEKMLDQLVVSGEERELYHLWKKLAAEERAERIAARKKRQQS